MEYKPSEKWKEDAKHMIKRLPVVQRYIKTLLKGFLMEKAISIEKSASIKEGNNNKKKILFDPTGYNQAVQEQNRKIKDMIKGL